MSDERHEFLMQVAKEKNIPPELLIVWNEPDHYENRLVCRMRIAWGEYTENQKVG